MENVYFNKEKCRLNEERFILIKFSGNKSNFLVIRVSKNKNIKLINKNNAFLIKL